MAVPADMGHMKLDDFPKIDIETSGAQYVVSEATLKVLLESYEMANSVNGWVFEILEIPQWDELSLPFLMRHHRSSQNLKVRELARRIHKDHKYLLKIEKGDIRRPEKDILDALSEALGPKFKKGLELIKAG